MRKLILLLLVACYSLLAAQSQTIPLALRMELVTWVKLEPKSYLAGGKVGTLNIEVRNYDVYQVPTSKQYYVNVTNSSGTTSRKYLGYKHGGIQEYEGNTIFFSADTTKAWIWTVDRYGQIFKMDLPDYFAQDARVIKTP